MSRSFMSKAQLALMPNGTLNDLFSLSVPCGMKGNGNYIPSFHGAIVFSLQCPVFIKLNSCSQRRALPTYDIHIVYSGYGLGDRGLIPGRGEIIFPLVSVQTGSGAHPSSCPMDTGDPFPGVKRGRSVTLTTHLHLVPRSRMSRSYTSPPKRLHGV
jgi:hypothetical protein